MRLANPVGVVWRYQEAQIDALANLELAAPDLERRVVSHATSVVAMRIPSIVTTLALSLGAAGLGAGCALPVIVHIPDPAMGVPVFSSCSLNAATPDAVRIAGPGVRAEVALFKRGDVHVVEARLLVPAGRTLVLHDATIVLDRRDGSVPQALNVPYISTLGPAVYGRTGLMPSRSILPVDGPLVGRSDFHLSRDTTDWPYSISVPIVVDPGDDVWITLPSFTVNGTAGHFPPVHFERRLTVALLGPNC